MIEAKSVYIVTLNWNGLADTLECLESLQNLTYPNVNIVVVDNNSKDNQAAEISRRFPQVNVLAQSENLGFCGGCNVGMKFAVESEADFVMLLNNDTLVPTDLIENLLTGLKFLKNVGAVSPIILEYPKTEEIWFSKAVWNDRTAKFRLALINETYEELKNKAPYQTEFACGCCLLVSKETIETVGLLDERYFAFYDEAEWCARMNRNDLKSYVIPSAFIYHKVSKSTPGLISTYLLSRNRLLWMKENLSKRKALSSIPYLLKELIWHSLNMQGLRKNKYYSKEHSRALVQGWKDYLQGKLGRWGKDIDKLIAQHNKK